VSGRVIAALWGLAVLAVAAPSRDAYGLLEPGRAPGDVREAVAANAYTFCRDPRLPLSGPARALCPHASAIPHCERLAAACASSSAPDGPRDPSRWTRKLSVPKFVTTVVEGLAWLLVAALVLTVLVPIFALVLAVLVPIFRALARMRRDAALTEPEAAEGATMAASVAETHDSTDEEALLARADDLARRGENGHALQLYLAASLRALDKRGALRLSRDRTNGEYVRACADANAKPALRDVVREVDRVQFGRAEAAPDAIALVRRQAAAIVRGMPAVLLLMALSMSIGCGHWDDVHVTRTGDDPAGTELFYDLLHAQGVRADRLDASLVSLPLPDPDERAPAVVVDMERTELDDDTSAHLVEWVKAGGVLVLAGAPQAWPREFGATQARSAAPSRLTARRLLARSSAAPVYARSLEQAELASGGALRFGGVAERVAWLGDEGTYAAVVASGRGFVLGIASDELMTNAGLARGDNAAAMVAVLSNADRLAFRIAQPEDGVSPPSSPVAAMTRAGLGPGLVHGLVAALLLFLAVGVRLARPRPAPLPLRRAFVEHVEAVGALYARTRSAPHALAVYARFVEERLRGRMPRGFTDVPSFLASRARMPLQECQRLWMRAAAVKIGPQRSPASAQDANPEEDYHPVGDELAVMKELSLLYAAAMAREK
jgi:hypothetical protein